MLSLSRVLRIAAVLGITVNFVVVAGPARASEPIPLAVLPIVVHSADDPDYLRNGLADMLSSRLEQSGAFKVIRIDDVSLATTRLPEAIETAKDHGAQFVLFGSFTRFGSGASLDMQCSSTDPDFETDPLREIFVHTGSVGEVIPDLDELVGKVGRFAIPGFGLQPAVASAPPAASGGSAAAALEARIRALEKAVAALEASEAVGPAQP